MNERKKTENSEQRIIIMAAAILTITIIMNIYEIDIYGSELCKALIHIARRFQQLIVCFNGSIVLLLNGHIYRHFARTDNLYPSTDFETEIADRQTIQINNSCVHLRDN